QPVVAVAAAGIAVQVGVRVDETGHHGVPGQVDHLGAARDVHVRPHRRDAFTTHDDGRVLGDPPGGGVEKSARADRDDALGGRLCLRRVRCCCCCCEGECEGEGGAHVSAPVAERSEEHTSELQSRENLVCRLLLEK